MRKGVSDCGSTGRGLASGSTSIVTEEYEVLGMSLRLSHLRHAGKMRKEALLENGRCASRHIQFQPHGYLFPIDHRSLGGVARFYDPVVVPRTPGSRTLVSVCKHAENCPGPTVVAEAAALRP